MKAVYEFYSGYGSCNRFRSRQAQPVGWFDQPRGRVSQESKSKLLFGC
jgi:hypothetical protein